LGAVGHPCPLLAVIRLACWLVIRGRVFVGWFAPVPVGLLAVLILPPVWGWILPQNWGGFAGWPLTQFNAQNRLKFGGVYTYIILLPFCACGRF